MCVYLPCVLRSLVVILRGRLQKAWKNKRIRGKEMKEEKEEREEEEREEE